VSLALEHVRLLQPEPGPTPTSTQSQQLQDLAQEEAEPPQVVAALKLDGQTKLEGGGQYALTFVLWTQLPKQLLLFPGILAEFLYRKRQVVGNREYNSDDILSRILCQLYIAQGYVLSRFHAEVRAS